jgi:hypothetical protein
MREVNGIDPGLNRKAKPNLRTPQAAVARARARWRRSPCDAAAAADDDDAVVVVQAGSELRSWREGS